jgi:hypothetical protein
MKKYLDYTEKELDELYVNLSEVAQDFVYSDIIKEEVANIGQKTGLHIDKWELLDTLVLETILGIVPSSLFKAEVQSKLGTTSEITSAIVTHMDEEIFSIIRDESVADYSQENSKNISTPGAGAIYDDSMGSLSTDPYRENVGGGHNNAPVITEEKLHLVDELFAARGPKIKELTPSDGSVRVPTEESRHVPELFQSQINIPESPSAGVITKASLEAEDNLGSSPFAGADKMEGLLKYLPPIDVLSTQSVVSTSDTMRQSPARFENQVQKNNITIHIEKSNVPGKVKLHISKAAAVSSLKIRPKSDADGTTGHVPSPVHYGVDPYKEVL